MNNKWAAIVISISAMLAMPQAYAEAEVARAVITSAIIDREPVDNLDMVPAENSAVVFFTDLRGMEGQSVKHVWIHGGEQMAEVSFDVGGPRWRVWSSKNMMPEWHGAWTVQVVNGVGGVVAEKSFSYGMAEPEAAGMDEAAPMAEEKPMSEEATMMDAEPAAGEDDAGTVK